MRDSSLPGTHQGRSGRERRARSRTEGGQWAEHRVAHGPFGGRVVPGRGCLLREGQDRPWGDVGDADGTEAHVMDELDRARRSGEGTQAGRGG